MIYFIIWFLSGFIPFILYINKDLDVDLLDLSIAIVFSLTGLVGGVVISIIWSLEEMGFDGIIIEKGKLFKWRR
ncbi:MAG: hypothetical protein ACOCZ5_00560 [bacterium]